MHKNIIIIHSHPSMGKISEEKRRAKEEEEMFVQKLVKDIADVNALLSAAHDVISAPDGANYISTVPDIMGFLYSYALRFNAIRRQLMDPDGHLDGWRKFLPDICHLCEAVESHLDILEDIYEQHVGAADDGEDGGCEKDDGGEMDKDSLCEVTIQYANDVPKQTIDLIAAGIHGVLAAYLGNVEVERKTEEGCDGCDGCDCDGCCCQES